MQRKELERQKKKGVNKRREKNKLFKHSAAKCRKVSTCDEVCEENLVKENVALDEARKTWNLGKQIGLYANKKEVIVALAKGSDARSVICQRGKTKTERVTSKSRKKKVTLDSMG